MTPGIFSAVGNVEQLHGEIGSRRAVNVNYMALDFSASILYATVQFSKRQQCRSEH